MSTGMYWSVIRDDFYLWLSIVSWCHFEWSCENNAQSAVMENKGNLRLLICCPSSWTAYRIQRTEVWFFWAKKKSCSLCFKNVNITHLYSTCNLFLSSSSIVSRGWTVALFAWRRADAPVVDADCDGVCVCVFTHASQMAKLSGKCNSQWTCNSWAAQEHEVLQASLLFNNIRITGLEVQLVRAVTRSLRSPFMRNIFEFHQLKKNK